MRKTHIAYYLGEADGRVFILQTARGRFGTKDTILFTPKSELDPEFLKQLEHGKKKRIP